MTDSDSQSQPKAIKSSSWRRRHPLAFGALLGLAGVAVAGVAMVIVNAVRHRPTPLTPEAYKTASALWDANGPASYNLDVELGGRRAGQVHVEVRHGEVTHMTRDGVEPKQKRTWYYWSVPGQLDTIELELEMAADPANSYGTPSASGTVLWAEFDPKYGYPRKFDRIVMGADQEVHWRVTRFEPIGEKSGSASGVATGQ